MNLRTALLPVCFFALFPSLFLHAQLTPSKPDSSDVFLNSHYHSFFLNESRYFVKNLGAPREVTDTFTVESDHGIHAFDYLLQFPPPPRPEAFSYIKYIKGSKQEEAFSGGFSQRLFRTFILEGDFRSISSPGFFINQSNKILNYRAALKYRSKNGIYGASVQYQPVKIESGQNGGIAGDSLIQNLANNEGKALQVNLPEDKLILRNKPLEFKQDLRLNFSTDSGAFIGVALKHNGHFIQRHYQYISPGVNHDYYENSYLDSVVTNDSSVFSSFYNTITAAFSVKKENMEFSAGPLFGFESTRYHLYGYRLYSLAGIAGAEAMVRKKNTGASVLYIYKKDPFQGSGYNAEADITTEFRGNWKTGISLFSRSAFPSYMSSHYYSNNFIWNHDFKNVSYNGFLLNASVPVAGLMITAGYRSIANYIYYDENSLPAQDDGEIGIFSASASGKLRLYRSIKLQSYVSYEKPENDELVRVPGFYTYTSLYIEKYLFKSALLTSAGTGLLYYSAYKANAFMPATSQFYLQNESTIGGYPYVDLFLNFTIRTVKFFIRLEHLNWQSGNDYFYLPHLPAPGRTLKVGLNWTFNEIQASSR